MTELLLIGLGIYLLTKGTSAARSLPMIDTATPEFPGGAPKHLVCPWFWKQRPAIFNTVPLNPYSRSNWLALCGLWRNIEENKLDIQRLEVDQTKANDPKQIEKAIKELKNENTFLFNETKRIANKQRNIEARYYQFLKLNFSDQEINDFYETRKKEIIDRIWPKKDTQVVPIVSPGNSTAIDSSAKITFDPGMGSKYDRNWLNQNPKGYGMPWYKADKKRTAAPPGKRVSESGNVYYEYRINRSDEPGVNI